jgi:dsDNA-binding SOS-regulon protein
MDKEKLRRRIANLADTYNELLASTGVPQLTEEQYEALKAFLMIVYEKSLTQKSQEES